MTTVYLLLGANIGDRAATLRRAADLVDVQVGVLLNQSSFWETAPWGLTDQPAFLNQAIEITTDFTPLDLLNATQSVEQQLGRVRKEKWGARLIDIDILFYGDERIDSPGLNIPHPFLPERRFALAPLAEIALEFRHPGLGKTVGELLAECLDESEVRRVFV